MGWRCSLAVGLGGSARPGRKPSSAKGGSTQGGQHRLSHLQRTLSWAAHRRGTSSRSWTGDPLAVFADVDFGNSGRVRQGSRHSSLRRTTGGTWACHLDGHLPTPLASPTDTWSEHPDSELRGFSLGTQSLLTAFWDEILIVELLTHV